MPLLKRLYSFLYGFNCIYIRIFICFSNCFLNPDFDRLAVGLLTDWAAGKGSYLLVLPLVDSSPLPPPELRKGGFPPEN